MDLDLQEQLKDLILDVIAAQEFDLVSLKINPTKFGLKIQVIADRPQGGITIDECAALNKLIVQEIENDQLIEGAYDLELSSPGIDWPLQNKKDYLRALNRRLRIFLNDPIEEKIEVVGTLNQVDEDNIHIATNAQQLSIPMKQIKKATQII